MYVRWKIYDSSVSNTDDVYGKVYKTRRLLDLYTYFYSHFCSLLLWKTYNNLPRKTDHYSNMKFYYLSSRRKLNTLTAHHMDDVYPTAIFHWIFFKTLHILVALVVRTRLPIFCYGKFCYLHQRHNFVDKPLWMLAYRRFGAILIDFWIKIVICWIWTLKLNLKCHSFSKPWFSNDCNKERHAKNLKHENDRKNPNLELRQLFIDPRNRYSRVDSQIASTVVTEIKQSPFLTATNHSDHKPKLLRIPFLPLIPDVKIW